MHACPTSQDQVVERVSPHYGCLETVKLQPMTILAGKMMQLTMPTDNWDDFFLVSHEIRQIQRDPGGAVPVRPFRRPWEQVGILAV